jgi:hypothetical protein
MALGSEGATRVHQQVENLHSMGVLDDDAFEQLKTVMVAGHDGAHPHLPKPSPERAGILLELMIRSCTPSPCATSCVRRAIPPPSPRRHRDRLAE